MLISKNQADILAGCRYPLEKYTFSDEIFAFTRMKAVAKLRTRLGFQLKLGF